MNKRFLRRWTPNGVGELERRTLLAAEFPTATWIGQDGHDLVGPYSSPGPDHVPDLHFALAGLPANRAIIQANISGDKGGQWMYNGPPNGPWAAALVRSPGSTTADLYIEPYQVEEGRAFTIYLTFDDASSSTIMVLGGTADPNLRTSGNSVSAQWLGQDGLDWTSPGPDVGPNGYQDAHLAVANLSASIAIQAATLTSSGGATWAFGTNPSLLPIAELIQHSDDPTRADLYFSPDGDLGGQSLTLTILYADGKTDSTTLMAGATDLTLRTPAPATVSLTWDTFTANWVGQDGQDLIGPGDVHIALASLPSGKTVVSAQLTDGTRTEWDYARSGTASDPSSLSLAFRPSSNDPTRADVDFQPIRDESNATLMLRLVLDDGTTLVTTFAGGAADPGLRASDIAGTSVIAQPGDDLNRLANQYGTVHLPTGTYNLSTPLVLNQPVTITADPGTTLLFAQGANDPTWTAAIKINAGHTTLDGFAVRFTGPIRWTDGISYGPAVIGTTDNFDSGPNRLKVDITLTHLDLESPPPSGTWEGATSLIRVASAQNGVIADNLLKGGTTEFIGGPWRVTGNTYLGTVPDTVTPAAFAGHYTHDVVIANNHVEPVGASGKTYRFQVLTQSGINDLVQGNTVIGVGPMDSDTVVNPNASEVLLTEAYRLEYEGKPASISPDGRIVQVFNILAGSVQSGDVLAILAGPQAGQWRLISQVINPTTFLLAGPIDPGASAVSIATGFVNESFVGNIIDTRGSSVAYNIDLAGNQFGVQVLNNTLLGGDRAFWISAYPSETPGGFGWTHAPVLGARIQGNTIEDSLEGGILDVDHGSSVKANVGRVYLTATLADNTGIWTDAFVAQRAQAGPTHPLVALTVGMAPSNDPGELVVSVSGNQVQGPASVVAGATLLTVAATFNGQAVSHQGIVLPNVAVAAPKGPPNDPGGGTSPNPEVGTSGGNATTGVPPDTTTPSSPDPLTQSPGGSSPAVQVLTPPSATFVRTTNGRTSSKSTQAARMFAHSPPWIRHPNPFRKQVATRVPISALSHPTTVGRAHQKPSRKVNRHAVGKPGSAGSRSHSK